MASEKNVNSRIQHKHDIEANWLKAINFIPKIGELIIYDPDDNYKYSRFKIGDGIRTINNLEFSQTDLTGYATENYVNEGLATKQPIGDYALKSDIPEDKPTIIDVLELPTENIDEDCFYRKLSGNLIFNQSIANAYTVYCVETLPETGEPATNVDNTQGNIYYDLSTNEGYGYVDSVLSAVLSVPVGWYPGAALLGAVGEEYAGIITNILDDPMDNKFRILLEYVIYSYKNGWTRHKSIGWYGTGAGAEVFNHPSNIASGYMSHAEGHGTTASGYGSHTEGFSTEASGDYSHAEGFSTEASGDYSHAEGHGTTASGYESHAEGNDTEASGDYSHAEGHGTTASGYESHAEGNDTEASGYYSHAEGHKNTASGASSHVEGYNNIASGSNQHVQGKYNIEDTEDKYAHVVGNGTSEIKRSNAHTIDWSGNAWFAGGVYIGGTSQDVLSDRLATEVYVHNAISNISPPVYNILGTLDEDGETVTLLYNKQPVTKEFLLFTLEAGMNNTLNYVVVIDMLVPTNQPVTVARFTLSEMGFETSSNKYYFLFKALVENSIMTIKFLVSESEANSEAVGTFTKTSMIPIPEYTEEDEGKVLRIVNGVPAWVSIPNAEEATF